MKPYDPIAVRVIPQRHPMDCLICCLAMLLGMSYEAVLVGVSRIKPDCGTEGLFWTEAIAAADALGTKLRVKNRYDADDTIGVVSLSKKGQPCQHAAVLLSGTLIDPDGGTVYGDWEHYTLTNGWKLGSILVRKGKQ